MRLALAVPQLHRQYCMVQENDSRPWRPSCTEDELLIALVNVKRAFSQRTGGDGVTVDPGLFPLLHHLAVAGRMRQGQLASAMRLDASTISRHVRSLARGGLIEAEKDEVDGRAVLLAITEKGRAALGADLLARRDVMAEGTKEFSTHERSELIRLLNKFTAALCPQLLEPAMHPVPAQQPNASHGEGQALSGHDEETP